MTGREATLADLLVRPVRVAVRLMILAFGDPDRYEARYSTLSDRFESVEVDRRALAPPARRGRSLHADPSRSPNPVWTTLKARLATAARALKAKLGAVAHVLLAAALGEVQKVAGGLLAEVPLSDLCARALGYFVPLAGTLALSAGLLPGLYYAALATVAVLAVNVVRVFLYIPPGL